MSWPWRCDPGPRSPLQPAPGRRNATEPSQRMNRGAVPRSATRRSSTFTVASPSGWRWSPATAALASGGRSEPTEPVGSRLRERGVGIARARPKGEDRREVWGAFGIGERQDLVAGAEHGGALDGNKLAVADH